MTMTDDDQKEYAKSFVKRYGSPIIIGILLALCGFFGWQWYHKKNAVDANNLTVQYQNLANKAGAAENDEKAYKAFVAEGQKLAESSADSAQAVQTQLLVAKLAFDRQDYATANKVLTQAANSKVKDEGLKAIAHLRLAYTQMAQNQLDAALKTLDAVKLESFTPSVSEAKGDIYVAQNKTEDAKKAYQQAWDLLIKRQQPRELLQIKLANLGVLVEDPKIESPVLTPVPSPAPQASAGSPSES